MRGQRPRSEPPGHVRVGQIVGVFGVKGLLKVQPMTDFAERFVPGSLLYLDGLSHEVLQAHWHKGQVRLALDGVTTAEEAAALQWSYLTVPARERPALGKGEYLASDLIGMTVVERGRPIGTVQDVLHAPAQDLIQIEGALIPCVGEFIKRVDLESRTIVVELIDGMRPGDEAEEVR